MEMNTSTEAPLDVLVSALLAVEWIVTHSDTGWEFCPWCKVIRSQRPRAGDDPATWKPKNHAPGCLRQHALDSLR